jgi:hypothetical protein
LHRRPTQPTIGDPRGCSGLKRRHTRGDPIRVDLEHAEGVALTVLLPYSQVASEGRVEYGQIRGEPVPARIWDA